jgi:SAM-dependent methyltransferase
MSSFPAASFDLVVSYVVLVDILGYRQAITEMTRVLRPGGRLVVANLSFMSVSNGWVRESEGWRVHFAMDRYLEGRPIELKWAGIEIVNWHRPLSAYMSAFLRAGSSSVTSSSRCLPTTSLRDHPYYEDWYRVPNFTVMHWQKRAPD